MEIRREQPVEEFIGKAKSNKFKIGDDSVGIIIDSLINLYSDPIGSIVREVTSNCYDAHREKRLKRKGVIPMTSEDKLQYWHKEDKNPQIEFQDENILLGIGNAMIFRDFGVGLSQYRVETIYTMFGNSTKRDNNLQIGGFGIGAKSPFAYTDTFYIIANHNGIKYSYMLYKGNDAFHMDMIKKVPTSDLNSTEVIIPIKEHSDLRTFRKSIEQQLLYFENIRYINVEEGLGANIKSIACDYEDEDLAISLDLKSASIDQELHCMVGRVRYPLDFNSLDNIWKDNYNNKEREIPAAIKFDIGEIDLVPSRENIRYTDRTKEAIKAKIESVRKSCIYDCNRELNNATDFIHWLEMSTSILKRDTWRRTYDSVFEIRASLAGLKKDDIKLNLVGELSVNPLLDKSETKMFSGFTCYTISKEPSKNHVGGYRLLKKVSVLKDFLNYPVYYQEQNYEPDEEGNVKTKTFRKAKDMAILNYVLESNKNSFIQLRKNRIDDKVIESEKEIDLWNNKQEAREPEVIKSDFEIMSKLIDGCKHRFRMYDDFKQEVSDDLVGEYESDQARRKRLGKIFGRKLYLGRNMDEAKFGNIETEVTDLGAYKDKGGIVIYGFSKDNELLKQIGGICRQNGMNEHAPEYANTNFNWAPAEENRQSYRDFHEGVVILKVAANLKDQLAEFINVNDLFKMKHDIIKKWYTSHLIMEDTEKINFFQFFRTLNENLFYKWRKLHRLHDKNYRRFRYLNEYQSDELLDLCKSNNLQDDKALETLKELKQYAEGLDLLKYIDIIQPTQEETRIENKQLFLELRKYLKFKNKATLKYKKIRKNNKKLVN